MHTPRKRKPLFSNLTFVFSPGRFDASPARVGAYARALINAHRAQVLVTTETYNSQFGIAIRKALPAGWLARRIGEYLVAWDNRVLAQSRAKALLRRLSHVYRDRQTWRDAHMATRHLVVRATGALVAIDDAHLPSGVERGTGLRPGPQATAHRAATAAWGRLIRRRLASYPATILTAWMDSNLDQAVRELREHMTSELGLPSIWEGRVPNRGTHGRRLIDTCHTNAQVLTAGVSGVPRPPGMDHTAIWAMLRIPTALASTR